MGQYIGAAIAAFGLAAAAHAQPADGGSAASPPPPSQPGALSPDNLRKPRPKPPFDLTGTWFVDLSHGMGSFMFGPPFPKLKPAAQAEFDAAQAADKEGRAYHDYTGACYPPGMPIVMTRVWPIAMVQEPTVIYMVSGFENAFRAIYVDGRPHTDPDVVVRSYNGESIGHWEGDALVVDTKYFETSHHLIEPAIPVSNDFHIVEHIRLTNGGKTLTIHYQMWDPQNWEGEWDSDKAWNRADDTDITEVECTPDLDKHLPATQSVLNIR